MLSEPAQVTNKTASAMVLKPAPIEQSQTVARVKASRAWAPAGSSRASTAEPIPAELRPVPKKALCILPMIRREGSSEHNRPVAVRVRWKDPRTGGARHISTAAIRGHIACRRRAHQRHLLLDSGGHRGGHRRVHHENRDHRLLDLGGLRGDFRNEDDWPEANCSSGQHCPTERARPMLRRIRRARCGQRDTGQARTRSTRAALILHPAARAPAWTERRC